MSDHESETSQAGSEGAWAASSPFSANGSHPDDGALATDDLLGAEVDDRTKFLADLARVMQSTALAEQARNAEETEGRLKSHVDRIRAREAIEAEDLRELAKEDVKSIDAWSEGEIKRIKLERERRIASRREQLQVRLEEHRGVVAREVEAVELAVAGYRVEVEDFFTRLESETDPIAIAQQAGSRPAFPDLEGIGPDGAAQAADDYGYVEAAAEAPAITDDQGYEAQQVQEAEPVQDFQPVQEAEPVQEFHAVQEAEQVQEAEPVQEVQPVQETEQVQDFQPVQETEQVQEAENVQDFQPVQEAESVQEAQTDQGGNEQADQPAADAPLVGVMDPEAGATPTESPWGTPVEANATADDGATPVEAEAAPEGEAQGEPEPEPALAEAHVVMPRSSGAGSWLRWPSNSIDRSDPDQ